MAENEDGQERSEQATGKRLEEARKKGQIARSKELNSAAVTLVSAGMLLVTGPAMAERLMDLMRSGLTLDRSEIFDQTAPVLLLKHTLMNALALMAPLLLVTAVAAIAASVALGGWTFSAEALAFDLDKLNPVKGIKRLVSVRGVVELVKALVKFLFLTAVAIGLLWHLSDQFLGLGAETPKAAIAHAAHLLGWGFLGVSLPLILIAAADVPFQLWDHARQMKMTKQEIKDEYKETEGKPEVKQRIRAKQREFAQARMMSEVPKADVVVTNPTHYAVALRYDAGRMGAPLLVAKGADLIAAQIRKVAAANDVVIMSAPPLARALYHSTELNQEIPAGLYLAVAQVLAYVYQLKAVQEHGGAVPTPPSDLPVPDEYEKGRGGPHKPAGQ
ncbi:MAG: flagellar biosynthesis protein FlhB [Gammaproteobacteria bacterium]